jgi:Activator of Hsp90 ATPase homolog 1-like protein
MSTALAIPKVEELTLSITEEIHVKATPEVTFAALLEELGPGLTGSDNKPLQAKIEAWPGGRWYRDLGNGNGHLWAHVQAIKQPTLLEFYGPLMMSQAVVSNVQYRLSEEAGGTLIKFHHFALGMIPDDHRKGFAEGWRTIHERAKQRAEKK